MLTQDNRAASFCHSEKRSDEESLHLQNFPGPLCARNPYPHHRHSEQSAIVSHHIVILSAALREEPAVAFAGNWQLTTGNYHSFICSSPGNTAATGALNSRSSLRRPTPYFVQSFRVSSPMRLLYSGVAKSRLP